MRIGIDLDGVCYDFVGALAQYIEHATGEHLSHSPSCWEFYETDWGMDLNEYIQWADEAVDAGWVFSYGAPLPDARESLIELQFLGHSIHIITDRNFGHMSEANTVEWLKRNDIPYDSLTFTADKASVHLDAAIDDRPKHVDTLRQVGVKAFLLDCGRTDQVGHPYLIPSWAAFLDCIEDVEWRKKVEAEVPTNEEANNQWDEVWSKCTDEDYTLLDGPVLSDINDLTGIDWDALAAANGVDYSTPPDPTVVRIFETGANRDIEEGKLDYEGFYSPYVMKRFAEYMHDCRHLRDGTLRDSDNWQRGMPLEVYMKSAFRHFMSVWTDHRQAKARSWLWFPEDYDQVETDLCALLFNIQGYLHEILKEKEGR